MTFQRRFQYSAWDGTQRPFEMDAFDLLKEATDDLLYHGDPNAALRRLMQEGFEDRNGERVKGLRELLERLRAEREERLANSALGGVFQEISDGLKEVVAKERSSLADLVERADLGGNERHKELAEQTATDHNLELDLLPDDVAGRVRGLEKYEFVSSEAQQQFEELVGRLREQLMQQVVDSIGESLSATTPEDLARITSMLAALNEMLEARARGEEPAFEDFMAEFGDMFPENPSNLDELLEAMAQRMAAMQALMNSMTPEQRALLGELSSGLFGDLDLQWQLDQLGQNLRGLFPDAGWQRSYEFSGADPLDFSSALEMMNELGELDQLEQLLRGTVNPGALSEVDLDRARALAGEEFADSLGKLSELSTMLQESGIVQSGDDGLELTPEGMRRLGKNALAQLFKGLSPDMLGGHNIDTIGVGHERTYQTKAYEFGDPFNLDINRTIGNAVRRRASQASPGSMPAGSISGSKVQLDPGDFEIEQTEQSVRSSTVLMLDLSLSMPMRNNFLPAKKVAMALHALISMQYPRDYLGIVGFSETAQVLTADQIPRVSWDFAYGTNMAHGFMLARKLLAAQSGTKQIIMITDGEPTAHLNQFGEPEFHYPPVRATVDATLLEVSRCTKERIRINTFMLDADPGLQHFVERMTELNRGRAFFTSPETLGDFVLVDFIEQRRSLLRGA